MAVDVMDHSLNLTGAVDERDQGFGIERLPDGSIVQRDVQERDATTRGGEPEH